MKQVFISLIFFLGAAKGLNAQFALPMDKGLKHEVRCACTDSLGNLYAVTNPPSSDSVFVNKWDINTRKWSMYVSVNWNLITSRTAVRCNFLYGKLYLFGIKTSSHLPSIKEYNGLSWKAMTSFEYSNFNYGIMTSILFQNKLYYLGVIDSIAGTFNSKFLEFNGINYAPISLNESYVDNGVLDVRNDTLFVMAGSGVYTYVNATLSLYYRNTGYEIIDGFAVMGNEEYVSSGGKIRKLRKGIVVDSANTTGSGYKLFNFGKRVMVTRDRHSPNLPIASFGSSLVTLNHFKNTRHDSVPIHFTKYKDNQLYMHYKSGIVINGFDYNNIVELIPDSFKSVILDTLAIFVFRDKNKNGIYDSGDTPSSSVIQETNSGLNFYTFSAGYVYLFPMDNEEYKVEFISEFSGDTCYKSSYSGAQSSSVFNSPLTSDTIFIPLWRTGLQNRNLILKSYSTRSAVRLDDSAMVYFKVSSNRDCDNQNTSVTLTVDIHPNVDIGSSIPAYSSKTGNTITYNLIVPYNSETVVKLKIFPSFNKFKVNDVLRHRARISMSVQEDSSENRDSIIQKCVYSYDPNAKYSVPEGKITSNLTNIRYFIEFQNEGNDEAWRVTVVDTLDTKIPVYEFRMAGSSHPYKVSHKDNIITWVFDNIYLKPKSLNEAASKGFIVFDAKVDGQLGVGDSIMNKAYIYFDRNEAIMTEPTVVKRVDNFENLDEIKTTFWSVFPNPVEGILHVKSESHSSLKMQILDSKGALVQTLKSEFPAQLNIDTGDWASGIYFLKDSYGVCVKIVKY